MAESFDDELARRTTELETARENRATDPEGWDRVKSEFAVWRRAIRILAGRPLASGGGVLAGDVAEWAQANPDHPAVVQWVAERAEVLRAELVPFVKGDG